MAEQLDSESASQQVYHATFHKVYAFVRSQVRDADTAQDLVAEIYLKVHRHISKIPLSRPAPWVFRIAHSTLIDYWRVNHRRDTCKVVLDDLVDLRSQMLTPEAAYARKERAVLLLRAMSALKPKDRSLLSLRFAGQRTNREIAELLSLSDGAVSMRLLRALRMLRDALAQLEQ